MAPLGCSSDAPPSAVVAAPPTVSDAPAPAVVAAPPTVSDAPAPAVDKLTRQVDQDVRQTSGEVQHEYANLKVTVQQNENEAKHDLKKTEEDLKKSAEKAVDHLLGDPK